MALACSEGPPPEAEPFVGKTWETEHYRYRYQEDDPMACEDVGVSLEAYGGLLVDALGIEQSAWSKTTYFKFPSQDSLDDARACVRSTARACTDIKEMFAVPPLLGHELVHNVMAKRTTTGVSALLGEGLANALSCAPGILPDAPSWDYRGFGQVPTHEDVLQAGRLMVGLLREVSPRTVMDMLAQSQRSDTPEQTRQQLLDVWGVDLEKVAARAQADELSACVPLYACSGAPLPEGTTRLGAGCRGLDPATLPRERGPIALRVQGSSLRVMPCDFEGVSSPIARLAPRAQGDWDYWMLPPSRPHALWLEGAEYVEQPLATEVSVSKQPAAFAPSCDVTQSAELEAGRRVAIVLTGSEAPLHFSMAIGGAARAVLSWRHGAPVATDLALSWCNRCADGAAADCQPLDLSVPRAISGRGVLRVEPAAALARAAVLELRVSASD
jgi:hypothetical protein